MKFSKAIAILALSSPLVLSDHAKYKGSVTVVNDLPVNGATCLTPVWVGIHKGAFSVGVDGGTFDTFNGDENVPEPLETLAEGGNHVPAGKEAFAANGTIWDGVVGEAPICPGETATRDFEFEADQGMAYYFSYASMILPSNDAWVSNEDPTAFPIIDEATAEFLPVTIEVSGSDVLDAATEVNVPDSMAVWRQETPNDGILDSFPDYTQVDKVMTITVTGEMVMGGEEGSMASGSIAVGLQFAVVICSVSLSILV